MCLAVYLNISAYVAYLSSGYPDDDSDEELDDQPSVQISNRKFFKSNQKTKL